MSKGNFGYNYKLVIKYLEKHDIEYIEYADGQHLRIMGPVSLVDLWPSRMTYHVLESERPETNRYSRMDIIFNEKQMDALMEGELL